MSEQRTLVDVPATLTPVAETLAGLDVPVLLQLRDTLRQQIQYCEVELAQVTEALERKLPSADEVQGILRG